MQSFIDIDKNSDFSIHNLPYGIFSSKENINARAGVAIGEYVLDLSACVEEKLLILPTKENVFANNTLNAFMELGKNVWPDVRKQLQSLLSIENIKLKENKKLRDKIFFLQKDVTMHLPIEVTGFTDFYSCENHAANVGKIFRPNDTALLPNWKHLPVAYNGRASTVVVSGTSIKRPWGQTNSDNTDPVFTATRALDFELELGFIIGTPNKWGERITTAEASDHVFGVVLLNDWSARDIQKWEYVPLGPFLSKAFATSISPWIVTLDALAPFQFSNHQQDPKPLSYLVDNGKNYFDINLEVEIKTEKLDKAEIISSANTNYLYWSMAQQIAHHTVGGCNLRTGDILGTGTISGTEENTYGSLLELTWGGKKPLHLSNGEKRVFIQDNDEIIFKGYAQKENIRVGFGECCGKILPAEI